MPGDAGYGRHGRVHDEATGDECHHIGDTIKQKINQHIHPPVDDASKILAAADRVYIELPFFRRPEESPAA